VFLMGDALAVTTPLGGQGMTCGLFHVEHVLNFLKNHRAANLKNDWILEDLKTQHDQKARYIFTHFTVLNTGLYFLFFSRKPFGKKLTQHVLSNWNRDPSHVDRLAALFGGIDLDTPSVLEVMKLWGVPVLGAQTLQESRVARIGRRVSPGPIVAWMMNQ
jgi:2-polyprenyl-6-methoxyphenol hydroxylase-like FAD-dependent oxidoreductase